MSKPIIIYDINAITIGTFTSVIAFISYIIIGLLIGYVCAFPLGMGAAGIWIGFIVGLTFAAVLFHTRFNRLYKRMASQCRP